MLIESKIRRLAGTSVILGMIAYHFRPDALGRHVADVEDEDHLSRFLSIPEGFRVAPPLAAPVDVQPIPVQPAALPPVPADPTPPVVPTEPVSAPPTSAIPVAAVVDDEDGQHEGVADDGAAEDGGNGDGAEEVDAETAKQARRDELAAEYKALFGRKPAYNKTVESMARDIAERKAADAKAAG